MSQGCLVKLYPALCQLQVAAECAPLASQPWLSMIDVDPVAKESMLLVGPVPPSSMQLSCGCMASTC